MIMPFRAVARALLQLEGFAVVGEAADARSALDAVGRLRSDVVVLDIQLPDPDGFEVARRLAQAESPVIVPVSSRDSSAYRRLAGSPARGFIPKSDLSGAAVAALVGSRMRLLGVAAAGLALAIAAESVTYPAEDPRLAAADATVGLPKSRYWIVSLAGRRWFTGSCDSRCSGSCSSSSCSMSAA